jgi:prevent-host-death family protein
MAPPAVVNMHEAKTHLSRLVEQVEAGEEIVIARSGKPVARLVPYVAAGAPRQPGSWKGQVWTSDDFDDLAADVVAGFEGS